MEYVGLILFLLQQLGMTLGVGASTFALVFYLSAIKDDVVDVSERRFLGMVYTVLRVGLLLIIFSGALITAAHVLGGEQAIVFEPAFLFKWFLIGLIVLNAVLMSFHLLPAIIGGPLAGATWYALFFLHNVAPEIGLPILLFLYALWLAFFTLIFQGIRMLTHSGEAGEARIPVPDKKPSLTVQEVAPSRVAATAPLRKIPEFQGVAGGVKLQPAPVPVKEATPSQMPTLRSTPPPLPAPISVTPAQKSSGMEAPKMTPPAQKIEAPRMPSPTTPPPQLPKLEPRPISPQVSAPASPPAAASPTPRPPMTSVMPRTASEMATPKPFVAAPASSSFPILAPKITPPATPSFSQRSVSVPQTSFAKPVATPTSAAPMPAQAIKPQTTYSGLPLRPTAPQSQASHPNFKPIPPSPGAAKPQANPDIPFSLGT